MNSMKSEILLRIGDIEAVARIAVPTSKPMEDMCTSVMRQCYSFRQVIEDRFAGALDHEEQQAKDAAEKIAQALGYSLKIDISRTNGSQTQKYLPGEAVLEIAGEMIPKLREEIRRRGLDGDENHHVMLALKTMAISLGICSQHLPAS